jgi:hypothetical protein
MCASRLDEIRKKLRDEISQEKDKTLSELKSGLENSDDDQKTGLSSIRDNIRRQINSETDKTISNLSTPNTKPIEVSRSSSRYAGRVADEQNQANKNSLITPIKDVPESVKVAPRSSCKALCIGMNKYVHINPPLPNAAKDAQDMAAVMNHLGYEVISIYDRNSEETKYILRHFLSSIETGDEVVLTFAGHGASFNSEPHLLPIDAKSRSEAINLYSEFIDHLKATNAKSAVIIIDACRDQLRIDLPVDGGHEISSEDDEWDSLEEWFEQISLQPLSAKSSSRLVNHDSKEGFGHAIIYSTSHDSSAQDRTNMQNGLFTHFFKTEVLHPQLSLTEIFENVRKKVWLESGGEQKPSFHDELSSKYYFYPQIN